MSSSARRLRQEPFDELSARIFVPGYFGTIRKKADHKVEPRIFNLRPDTGPSTRVSSECRNTRCSVCLKGRPITTDLVDSSPAGRYPAQTMSDLKPARSERGRNMEDEKVF